MRKFFLGAALVAASFGMAQSADAATVMDVDGVSTVLAISDYEGTYNGTMDQIKMRGEDYEPRAASYTLENGILSCDFPQIGSMPGNITIELEVEVDEETGEITAFKGDKAGTLTILGMDLVTLKLDSLTDAKVTGYSPHPMGKTPLSCQQGCYAAKNTSGMQPTARKQNYPNRLNRF